jgi:hypothetical protein
MATRTLKATIGMQPKDSPTADVPTPTAAVQPDAALTSPDEPSMPATVPPATLPTEDGVGADVAGVEEKEQEKVPDTPQPRIIELAEKDLNEIIEKLQSNLDSLKEQKSETPDHLSLMKLSCAKVLREAAHKVTELQETVAKMRSLSDEVRTRQMGLDEAIEKNGKRSAAFRTERAAFIKLKAMSEKEYYALVNELMARDAAAKLDAAAKSDTAKA